jgi:ATP-dependent Clp protease protease subunit
MEGKVSDEVIVNRFSEESASKFRKQVQEISHIDPSHPITIYIDSYGGEVYSLLSMIETLRQVPNPIITVCMGKAMSCGAVLLAMGDHRFCGKDSQIMIHEMSAGAFGSIDDIKTEIKECDRLNARLMTIIAEKCGKTYAELKAVIVANGGRELYLDAKEAKAFGLVEQIGMPQIKPIVMYTIDVAPEKSFKMEKESDSSKTIPAKKSVKRKKKSQTKTVPKTKKRK